MKRSETSYKREIASLNKALHDECENSLRLSGKLQDVAVAWLDFDQEKLDELLGPHMPAEPEEPRQVEQP